MSTLHDHPWSTPLPEKFYLRNEERISIYGTEYWDLATPEERRLLGIEEMMTWWSGFIHLESLVIEAYQAELNNNCFERLPEVREYMHHFIKEELVHTIVFEKAIRYFGGEVYEKAEFLGSFFRDHACGKDPLLSVYLTMIIEWVADEYQRLDVSADYIHPMAKTVVLCHWKEEMRHIKWGQNMIKALIETDQEFKLNALQLTPIYLRQQIDQGITNLDCFARVNFKHDAFLDKEKLLDTVLYSNYRKKLNSQVAKPLLSYFINSGIYDVQYHDIWASCGFADDINELLEKTREYQ